MKHDHDTDFDSLLSKLTDGGAGEEDLRHLGRMLEGDAARQRAYFDWIANHLLLEQEGALRAEVEQTPPSPRGAVQLTETADSAPAGRPRPLRGSRAANPWVRYALAAVVLLVAGGLVIQKRDRSEEVVMATVVDAIGIVGAPRELTAEGSVLDVGLPLRFEAGVVSIAMPSGAEFTLEGPASIVVSDDNRVKLDEGRLYASVPPSGVGFTVDAPTASLVDLGTEFGVVAHAGGAVESYVYVGEVRAETGDSASELGAGMAVAVPADGGQGVVSAFDPTAVRFTRSIDGSDYLSAVDLLEPLYMYRFSPDSKRRRFSSVGGSRASALLLQGGVYAAAGGPITTPQSTDGCLRFVGVESETEVHSVEASLEAADEYTIVLWARVDERGPQGLAAFTSKRGSDVDLGAVLRIASDGRVEHRCHAAGNDGVTQQTSTTPLPRGVWAQVVACGGSFRELRLYINGESAAQPTRMNSAIRADCGRLMLGSGSGRQGDEAFHTGPLRGAIDEVVVFDRLLTSEEVRAIYRAANHSTPHQVL